MPKAETPRRSRKGCTECRKRKIKCDERSPTCGQCQKAGRDCPIVDSVFRLHPYSFSVQSESSTGGRRRESRDDEGIEAAAVQPPVPANVPPAVALPPPPPPSAVAAAGAVPEPRVAERGFAESVVAQPPPPAQDQYASPQSSVAAAASSRPPQASNSPVDSRHSAGSGSGSVPPPPAPSSGRNWLAISSLTQVEEAAPSTPSTGIAPSAAGPPLTGLPENAPSQVGSSPGSFRTFPPSAVSPSTPQLVRTIEDPQEANEVTFFIRQYCESLGRSIDMFGRDQYFGRLTTARQSDLIKYAACAAAAKQLGHMKDPNAHARPTAARQAVMHVMIAHGRDFLWYGAKYYGKSIQAMAADISQDAACSPSYDFATPEFSWTVPSPNSVTSGVGQETEHRLLAASIMCQYEQLSASTRAWAGHLNGIYKLLHLDRADTLVQDGAEPSAPSPAFRSGGSLRSLFWFFVRNDIEESFISGKETRVDCNNNPLWRTMGLPLDHSGRFSGGALAADGSIEPIEGNVVALNAMTRLLCKVITLVSTSPRAQGIARRGGVAALVPPGEDQVAAHTAQWTAINDELDLWLEALPPSFQSETIRRRETGPMVGISSVGSGQTRTTPSEIFGDEVWFADSTCAMSILYYHMARILMVINKPVDVLLPPGPVRGDNGEALVANRPPDWLVLSRSLQKEISQHAKSTIAIALGLPEDGVRMHMLQPLYVAGRCLTNEADQRMLIELLEGIERDLGVATGYRVTALIQEWGTSSLSGTSLLDRELSDLSSPVGD